MCVRECRFIGDSDVVLLHAIKFQDANSAGFSRTDQQDVVHTPPWGVRAGPRATIYHDPSTVSAAVVTCGGLCPGLNDVIQNIVYTLQVRSDRPGSATGQCHQCMR